MPDQILTQKPKYPPANSPDPWAPTIPQVVKHTTPARSRPGGSRQGSGGYYTPSWMQPRRRFGCLPLFALAGLLVIFLVIYFIAPSRTNILLLGIDYTPPENAVGRSDTIIITTFRPSKPYVGMLSIPRDLWVNVPGAGENRINTAHFFAEARQAGSGPAAALQTIHENFGIDVGYYVRIRFDGFREVFNAMGGVDLVLPEPMAGYPAGAIHLTGNKALAFARQRIGSDDFFRMERGQMLLRAAAKQMLNPLKWPHLPAVLIALSRAIDTNVPTWMWPRLGMTILRVGPDGVDSRTINRDMATPYVTAQGADILIPQWELINPLLMQMFGQ